MGLDVVEIVMAAEERFSISIPDDAEGDFSTVGGLHEFIVKQLDKVGKPDMCLSSSLFYRLRRALIQHAGVPRNQIRPDADLRQLVPFFQRRRVWKQIRQSADITLYNLRFSPIVNVLAVLTTITLAAVLRLRYGIDWQSVIGLSFFSLLLWPLLLMPFRAYISVPAPTLRNFIEERLPPASGNEQQRWIPELVWTELQEIISSQLSIDKTEVTPSATWQELGAG
ncbi:MAG: acyl carrier protein [Candidatus Sumerlaeaceae bacterium]